MSRERGRRGLVVVVVLLVLVVLIGDLIRSDSLILGALEAVGPGRETPAERLLRMVRGGVRR